MEKSVIPDIVITVCLILAQVLICNHIMLFGVAMAFVFIYPIIRLPLDLKTDWLLTWAFLSGLVVDFFSDTPGVNSLSCVLLAMMKRPKLFAYIPRDDRTKNMTPSLHSLGIGVFSKYLLSMSAVYCFMAFTIEFFNFADIQEIVIMTAASALLTFLLILGIDSIVSRK